MLETKFVEKLVGLTIYLQNVTRGIQIIIYNVLIGLPDDEVV
jgi:hypothetical protein